MEDQELNRMANARNRGRPTLAEAAERARTPPPGLEKQGGALMLKCSRCGCLFEPKVCRTVGEERQMRCNRCGYTHRIPPELLERIISQSK